QTTTGLAGLTNSGLSLASYLLGAPSQFTRMLDTATDAEDAQPQMGYFFQDTWRVSRKLTLSLCIPWDTWFPNESVNDGQGGRYELANNTYYVAGVGGNSKSAGINTQWHNLSPRVGIAYTLGSKTVVSTGFGRSYFSVPFGYTFGMTASQF